MSTLATFSRFAKTMVQNHSNNYLFQTIDLNILEILTKQVFGPLYKLGVEAVKNRCIKGEKEGRKNPNFCILFVMSTNVGTTLVF